MSDFLESNPELLSGFLDEAVEYLRTLEEGLMAFESQASDGAVELRDEDDRERMNEVFRAAHSLKGTSASLGFDRIREVTHVMESLFDQLRGGVRALYATELEVLFSAVDTLRSLIDEITEPVDPPVTIETQLTALNEILGATPGETASCDNEAAPPEPGEVDFEPNLVLRVTFHKGDGEAPILAAILFNRLGENSAHVSATPDVFELDASAPLNEVVFQLQTDQAPAEVEAIARAYSVDKVESGPPQTPEPPAAPETPAENATPAPEAENEPPQRTASGGDNKARVGQTIRVDLERLDQLLNLGGELVVTKARFGEITRKLSALTTQSNIDYVIADMADQIELLKELSAEVSAGCNPEQIGAALRDTLTRVTSDYDALRPVFNRLSESRSAINEFGAAVHSLNRISESMQRRIMQTRMVPIGPLFHRFRRVVRDIGKATGKKAEIVLHGEATELDKRMIDELVDPLTHMVRNSVDHGLESPEDRLAAGKEEAGTITLDAFHRGRHICVEVRDDGRGLNVARIRGKIVERGLATQAQVDQMSDHEAMQFIFRPGFSTAGEVTDLSGRGMGMDIVRAKVEALNGVVSLDSVPGQGTTFTIQFPLTLAIIPAMMVRIGRTAYAVPLETVIEITTVPRSAIKQVRRQAVIRLRDNVIPLSLLENILSMQHPNQHTSSAEGDQPITVMIVGFQKERLGLVVDGLLGQEDIVIKDIATNLHNVEGVAGASIMGNGTVSLILDVAALMSNFARAEPQNLCESQTATVEV